MKLKLPARQGLHVANTRISAIWHQSKTKQKAPNNNKLLNFSVVPWSHKRVMDYLKIIFKFLRSERKKAIISVSSWEEYRVIFVLSCKEVDR